MAPRSLKAQGLGSHLKKRADPFWWLCNYEVGLGLVYEVIRFRVWCLYTHTYGAVPIDWGSFEERPRVPLNRFQVPVGLI